MVATIYLAGKYAGPTRPVRRAAWIAGRDRLRAEDQVPDFCRDETRLGCLWDYAAMLTSVPGGTSSKSSTTSWFRMRMHPIDPGFPISTLSGLPWM